MSKINCMACLILSAAVTSDADAFSHSETNEVAIAILEYAAMDNDDTIDVDVEYPVRYTSWDGLLDSVSFAGWTRNDKDAAVREYLQRLATNDFAQIDGSVRELMRIGLCELRDLNCTNALSIIRDWSLNPAAAFREMAIHIYYTWKTIDEDWVLITRKIITNGAGLGRTGKNEMLYHVTNAIGRYRHSLGKDGRYTNAVHVVYQTRSYAPECAPMLDGFFASEIPEYVMSSNRLETVIGWLGSTNCSPDEKSYCVSVTNRLMNAPHPLQLVESLRGL